MKQKQPDPSRSFPPIVGNKPRILILGTMPGQKSLLAEQYYAHPQNQFWKIMGELYGAHPALPYAERVDILKAKGIAVWDVVHSCIRPGSMDSDITDATLNDFKKFFADYKSIKRVVFDSGKAEQLYTRFVLPSLSLPVEYHRVPSPSPAYAKLPYAEKLKAWKQVLLG